MKKLLKYSALTFSSIATLLAVTNTYATSYEIFADLNYNNPAALNSVKDYEVIVGGAGVSSNFHFSGTAAGVPGSTSSNTTDLLPYGRFAKRLSPKWVASFDISQPIYTDIRYPTNNFANQFATITVQRDTNYSPKLSYQATPQLALGIGLDANDFYDGELSFAVPPFGNMTNKASSWAYGWDAGLFYVFSPATFLSVNYYSQIIQHASGYSKWGFIENNSLSADVKLPATTIVNLIHMLSPKWALSGTVRYAQWDTLRYTVLQNTALGGATITVPDHFFNNFSYELATHYQLNEKWAVLGAVDYEPNVQPTFTRNIGLPTYTRYIPAIGAEYNVTKNFKFKAIYAHPFSHAPINMNIPVVGTLQGTDNVNVNVIDLSLTYDA